jgi:hypothetical protein
MAAGVSVIAFALSAFSRLYTQHLPDEFYAGLNAACGRVYRQVVPVPWFISATANNLPIRKDEARHFACPVLDAPPMLLRVRAYRLDFDDARACPQGNISPSFSGQQAIIDCVSDDIPAEEQIVLRNSVSPAIASVFY